MKNSAVTDNNWVCDKATRATDLFTLGVVGIIVGVAIFSTIADYKGRKPSFFICVFLMMCISIITVFVSHSYAAYLTLKVSIATIELIHNIFFLLFQ